MLESYPDRDRVVEVYGAFVRRIASKLARDLRLRSDVEDLVQLGHVGLLEAWDRYDPESGVPFRGFAWYRVRGAMIDGVKHLTGNTRAQLRQLRRLSASNEFQSSLSDSMAGNEGPSGDASYLQMVVRGALLVADIDEAARDVDAAAIGSISGGTPESLTSRRQQVERLRAAMSQLSSDAQDLLRRHYFDGESLAAIGADMGLSRSWMCRRHARAVRELHQLLDESDAAFFEATSPAPRRFIGA